MTVEFKDMNEVEKIMDIRRSCLNKYQNRAPKEFLRFDHHGLDVTDGGFSYTTIWGLIKTPPVRVLINGQIQDRTKLAQMIRDIASNVEQNEDLDFYIQKLGNLDKTLPDAGEIPF